MPVELLGKEVRFLVPVLRNTDKQPHATEQWEWLEFEMYSAFPAGWQQRGLQGGHEAVRGRWFDVALGQQVLDDCIEFVVAVAPERMPALFRLLDGVCSRFDQKCIYFTTGGDAALYHPSPPTDAVSGDRP